MRGLAIDFGTATAINNMATKGAGKKKELGNQLKNVKKVRK